MPGSLTFMDAAGPVEVTYEDAKKYHGKDFHGGVALALKALALAMDRIGPDDGPPARNDVRVILGFNPPGVVDALEYATRAFTRNRAMVDPNIGLGPESVFGNYYFEFHCQDRKIAMTLKPGVLPEDFTELARKSLAGIATDDERGRWTDYKLALGDAIMEMNPEQLLDILDI